MKLTDTQTLLLSHASQHASLSLYPLPERHAGGGARVAKALDVLLHAELIEERETSAIGEIARQEGDVTYGLYINAAGLAAIGVEPAAPAASAPVEPTATEPATPKPPRQTKAAVVLGLIQREEGATLADLIGATGWLPHTTRAALTGLRKKGHAISTGKVDGVTRYSVGQAV